MKIVLASILGAVAIAAGVYVGLYLWSGQQAKDRAELAKWCMLRAEYWARAQMPDRMEPECVAIGIYP